ncbi:MAG: hypothetical protein CMH55_10000 [Myxococcales bacterium]|nr:hypothetical protein [Myxococcales bacterium]|tara:strand:+ start:668 stop:1447 length:780 start_codon:yes stop_codon:yes gene_type:complete
MSDDLWYWRREGTVYGPVDTEAFEERIETGQVGRGDPVRSGSGAPWQRLEHYPEWEAVLETAEERGVRPGPSQAVVRRRRLMGLVIGLVVVILGLGLGLRSPTTSPSPPLVSVPAAPLPAAPPVLSAPEKPDFPKPKPKPRPKRSRKKAPKKIVIGSNTAPKDGGLSGEAIARGFRRGLPRIQACAKRYATGGGQIPSKMAVSYSIRNSGSVTEAKVRPHEIAQTPLGRCIVGVLRRLQYPSYRGEARTVSFPLAFNQK